MRGRRFRSESHYALCQVSRQRSWDLEKRRRHRRAPPGTARLAQAGCSSRLKHSSVPTCEHFGRAHHRHKPFRTSSPAPNSTGDARRTTPTPSAGNGPACSRIGKGASLARVSRMVGRADRTRTRSAGLPTRSATSAVAMSVSEVFHSPASRRKISGRLCIKRLEKWRAESRSRLLGDARLGPDF